MKIAINKCYGGFGLSEEAALELRKLGVRVTLKGEYYSDGSGPSTSDVIFLSNEDFGITSDNYYEWRTDKRLIKIIEKIGIERSGGYLSKLIIVDIPDDIKWEIDEYDGIETVHEQHKSW
jgi:hypothetical protein